MKTLSDLEEMDPTPVIDHYVIPDYQGILLGSMRIEDRILVSKPILVEIDTSEISVFKCIRYGAPATYEKTYDDKKTQHGEDWLEALKRGKKVSPTCTPYVGADIPMKVISKIEVYPKINRNSKIPIFLQKIKNKFIPQYTDLVKVGETIGRSTTYTEWNNVKKFNEQLVKNNLQGKIVIAELSHEGFARGGNTWGGIKLELIKEKEISNDI